ncbi:MAG: PQQ-binding-like beta-propeller repeat protein [Deltaproteobacteria bacterium]|nr:PQQ-binding-like beta-propeller repeat protein [Deltaproteobacteria bacterium]
MSSTFADLAREREALEEHVFRRLRRMCSERGARFQAIDLRWGVSSEASLEHSTVAICLREIERCRQVSPRPNFIVLLGERYGWRPLPRSIVRTDFERIVDSSRPEERALLLRWYVLDDNAVPAEVVLRARTGDAADGQVWEPIERAILEALLRFDPERYGRSVTEEEILRGAFAVNDAPEHVFCYSRRVRDLPADSPRHRESQPEARERLARLEQGLRSQLGANFRTYEAHWTGSEVSADHLAQLCHDVHDDLSRVISDELTKLTAADSLDQERETHAATGRRLAASFVGREALLGRLLSYLTSTRTHPLLLWGPSGSGKSAALAKAAEGVSPGAVLVQRFLGTTPMSSDGRSLLHGLCSEIARAYSDSAPVPVGYAELQQDFEKRLALAAADRPLILFLDGVDQLSARDPARSLSWLPSELPPHARVVASVLSDEPPAEIAPRLPAGACQPLDRMTMAEGEAVLDTWLEDARRTLQPHQRQALLGAFNASGIPLFLMLAFGEARGWTSFLDPSETKLPGGVPELVRRQFARLSRDHGLTLVQRSLCYLAVSRDGLSEDELLDVLSNDSDVRAELRVRSPLSPRVASDSPLPFVVWSRLRFDLGGYISERGSQGAIVLSFFHRQVLDIVRADNLASTHAQMAAHAMLESYFAMQPLVYRHAGGVASNLRKLHELPYQQTNAQRWSQLFATLTDLRFIEQKATHIDAVQRGVGDAPRECWHEGVFRLMDDLRLAVARWPSDLDSEKAAALRDWLHFLEMEHHVLQRYPEIVGQQAINQPRGTTVQRMASAQRDGTRWLVRSGAGPKPRRCLMTLVGHKGPITGVFAFPDGERALSAGEDGSVRIWSLASGEQLAMFQTPGPVKQIGIEGAGREVVCLATDRSVRVYSTEGGMLVRKIEAPANAKWAKVCADGHLAAFGLPDNEVGLWRCLEGKALVSSKMPFEVRDIEAATGSQLVVSVGGQLAILDLPRLRFVALPLTTHLAFIHTDIPGTKLNEAFMSAPGAVPGTASIGAEKDIPAVILPGGRGTLDLLRISAGGAYVAATETANLFLGATSAIRVWSSETCEELVSFEGLPSSLAALAFLPGTPRLVTSAEHGRVQLWDCAAGERLFDERVHDREIVTLAAAQNGHVLAGTGDGALLVLDVAPSETEPTDRPAAKHCETCGLPLVEVRARWLGDSSIPAHATTGLVVGHTDRGEALVMAPRGRNAIVPNPYPTRGLFMTARTVARDMKLENEPIEILCATGDGRTILGGTSHFVVWDGEGKELGMSPGIGARMTRSMYYDMTTLGALRGGLVASTNGKRLHVWDARTGSTLLTRPGSDTVAFSPDRQIVASTSEYGARLYLGRSGHPLTRLSFRVPSGQHFVVAPDGAHLFTASGRSHLGRASIHMLRSSTGEIVWTNDFHEQGVTGLVLTPNGRILISGDLAGNVLLLDATTGELLRTLKIEQGIRALCVTPDSVQLLVLYNDSEGVGVWDLATATRTGMFICPRKPTSVAAARNFIAVGDAAGELHLLRRPDCDTRREYGTATRTRGGRLFFWCNGCGRESPVAPAQLGGEYRCAACRQVFQLNPLVLEVPWTINGRLQVLLSLICGLAALIVRRESPLAPAAVSVLFWVVAAVFLLRGLVNADIFFRASTSSKLSTLPKSSGSRTRQPRR